MKQGGEANRERPGKRGVEGKGKREKRCAGTQK